MMGGLIYAIEIRKWNRANWTQFFVIPGKNPLFIYLLSEVLAIVLFMVPMSSGGSLFAWINKNLYQKLIPGAIGSLLFALSFMLICWSVGWLLNRKKIYIRV